MNILLVTGVFPPRSYGGVTATSYAIAKKLAERGNKVTVFTTDVGNNQYSRLNVPRVGYLNGINVHYFKNLNNMLAFKHRVLTPVEMPIALIRQVREVDVIHLNGFRNFHDAAVGYFAKKFDVPYLQQSHGDLPRIMTKRRLKQLSEELYGYRILQNASRVIALNQLEAERYMMLGIPKEKVAIIPNGIDLSEYSRLPLKGLFKHKYGIPENKKVILYLSRIDKIKGVDFLVQAYAHLMKTMLYTDAILVIAGPDEGFLSEVNLLAKSLGVSKSILFTGAIYGEEKLQAYVDSDVYVLPSRYETFPMGLLEAYACCKPVITSNVGGLKDLVIDGNTGFLINEGEIKLFAEKLHFLLNNNDDAKAMGLHGNDFVCKNYSIDRIVSKLEHVYEEMMK